MNYEAIVLETPKNVLPCDIDMTTSIKQKGQKLNHNII